MAWGPNRHPGRCEVPPSNGAPRMTAAAPAYVEGSPMSAAGTPANVASGPYMLPVRMARLSPETRSCGGDPGRGTPVLLVRLAEIPAVDVGRPLHEAESHVQAVGRLA